MDIEFNKSNVPDVLLGYKSEHKLSEDFYERGVNPLLSTRLIQYEKIIEVLDLLDVANVKSLKILDVGCGDGTFVEYLLGQGYSNVEGIDPAVNFSGKLPLKKASIEDYINSSKKYDLIFLNDVFEHFENPKKLLGEIKLLLEEDGLLSLKVPNKESLLYKIGKFLYGFGEKNILHILYQVDAPPPHYYYYSSNALDLLAGDYDLVPENRFYMSEFPFKGLWDRVWHFSGVKKILAVFFFFVYDLITVRSLKDSVCVIYRSKSK